MDELKEGAENQGSARSYCLFAVAVRSTLSILTPASDKIGVILLSGSKQLSRF